MGGVWRVQVSMMDEEVFQNIWGVLSTADGVRRDGAARSGTMEARDSIGDLHLLLFGDFKQLPPVHSVIASETNKAKQHHSGHWEGTIHRAAQGA